MELQQIEEDQSLRALKEYSERLGQQPPPCFNRDSLPWHAARRERQEELACDKVFAEIADGLVLRADVGQNVQDRSMCSSMLLQARQYQGSGWAEDSDEEEVRVCHLCKLPLGDIRYSHRNFPTGACFHGECKAQLIAQDRRDEEESRLAKEKQLKSKLRGEYCIGWDPKHIPRTDSASGFFACSHVPQGMVCLVLNEDGSSVRVASTSEPAAAINLEYLSIALQVRRREGHEPIFSLDPVEPDDTNSMQKKVFVPDWLAGTSVGEVLFQADYHLKELSMGDHAQPIVGMKSSLDYSEDASQYSWSAREWFYVRKAEMQISDADMLIPLVKMGVEAREQKLEGNVLKDVAVTRPDHPMVLYAEAFTGNFDLIAERRSVIYYLRELAKASVLAKFLLDPRIKLDDSWFCFGKDSDVTCSMEVPQLWNERIRSQLELADGKVSLDSKCVHSVYGGVRFNLNKFNLASSAAGQRVSERASSASLSSFRAPHVVKTGSSLLATPSLRAAPIGMSAAQLPPQARFLPPQRVGSMAPIQLQSTFARTPVALSARSLPGPFSSALPGRQRLQGVDLRLDSFDLSSPSRLSPEVCAGGWNGAMKPLNECAAMGGAFWTCLYDDSNKLFKDEDRALLKDVFRPALCDRQREGELFVPPSTVFSYVVRLQTLLKEEHSVRHSRKLHFLSTSFDPIRPSSLFPWSWASSTEVAGGNATFGGGRARDTLQPRPDLLGQAVLASVIVIENLVPCFDRSTEDGLRFRIYRHGALELRTTQELDSEEVVGAVFSIVESDSNESVVSSKSSPVQMQERISKVTEYVERVMRSSKAASGVQRTYFLVMQTDKGNRIMTERLRNGDLTWQLNPAYLEDRISFAKVTRSKECKTGVTVMEMREIRIRLAGIASQEGRKISCKRYSSFAFDRATGSMLTKLGS